jgi:hypothetical protein
MFNKVLIADDLGSINTGVLSKLKELQINAVFPVQYCDDAYLHVKSAARNNQPYELLITDLSFKSDHRAQRYASGDMLVKSVKQEYPELKKYDIHNNKGYGTKKHMDAIKEYGITKWHRKSFGICKEYS